MSNQLYYINYFDGVKNNSFVLSQKNITEFLIKNTVCETLVIQGKLDLLHHQSEQNEITGNALLNFGINIIMFCVMVNVVLFIIQLLTKVVQKTTFMKSGAKIDTRTKKTL